MIPNNSSLGNALVPNAKMAENGKTPASLAITASGSTISWRSHPEEDIIGYRVYSGGKKVASIKADEISPIQVEMDHTMSQQWIFPEKNQHHPIPHSVGQPVEKPADAILENPDQKIEKSPEKTEEVPATSPQPASPPAETENPAAQEKIQKK